MMLLVVSDVAGHATDDLHRRYTLHISTLLSTVFATPILICLVIVGVIVGTASKDNDRVFTLTKTEI